MRRGHAPHDHRLGTGILQDAQESSPDPQILTDWLKPHQQAPQFAIASRPLTSDPKRLVRPDWLETNNVDGHRSESQMAPRAAADGYGGASTTRAAFLLPCAGHLC